MEHNSSEKIETMLRRMERVAPSQSKFSGGEHGVIFDVLGFDIYTGRLTYGTRMECTAWGYMTDRSLRPLDITQLIADTFRENGKKIMGEVVNEYGRRA